MSDENICPKCGVDNSYQVTGQTYSRVIGVEYAYGSPERYDGVSEWKYPCCGVRIGRWTGKELGDGEVESRYGTRGVVRRITKDYTEIHESSSELAQAVIDDEAKPEDGD